MPYTTALSNASGQFKFKDKFTTYVDAS